MFPLVCFSFDSLLHKKNNNNKRSNMIKDKNGGLNHSVHCNSNSNSNRGELKMKLPLGQMEHKFRERRRMNKEEEIKERKREMAGKVANISDIIHRVASSCLTNPTVGEGGRATRQTIGDAMIDQSTEEEEKEEEDDDDDSSLVRIWGEEEEKEEEEVNAIKKYGVSIGMELEVIERVKEMECFMSEVFEAVSAVKRAYVSLQEAHCPWDLDGMRVADASVVAELRRLGRLRDRFRRGGAAAAVSGAATHASTSLREVVAPYEEALKDLKKELKAKETEVENLKAKLRTATTPRTASGRRMGMGGRLHSSNKVGCISRLGSPVAPTAELFESCMEEVKSASKSFTANLLSLMRSARWDIVAAARSIIDNGSWNESAGASSTHDNNNYLCTIPAVELARHAKYALESYINRKIFCGFENETFYMEEGSGLISSLLNPSEFRSECFSRFHDMRAMEPGEILGILPSCQFGKFCGKKYLSIIHPKMEESLFGGVLEQRRQVLAGAHPTSGFYGDHFLRLAKSVWLLHLLAFALDPSPSHFEATKGTDFHHQYMESVVRFSGGRVPPGSVVAFSVGPGFKLGNGSVVRARVYLLPRARA